DEAPLREAVRRVYGQDSLPEFDIANARYVLSFGSDFLGTWLSPVHYSVEYGAFRQGSYRAGQFQPRQGRPRGYLVQVEPRMSMTAANADEWVPVTPGAEGLLALGMAQVIASENLGDPDGMRAVNTGAVGRSGGVVLNPPSAVEGLPTVRPGRLADWQQATTRLQQGQVPLVLLYGANPAYSLPSLQFREALQRAPYIISFSSFLDETT